MILWWCWWSLKMVAFRISPFGSVNAILALANLATVKQPTNQEWKSHYRVIDWPPMSLLASNQLKTLTYLAQMAPIKHRYNHKPQTANCRFNRNCNRYYYQSILFYGRLVLLYDGLSALRSRLVVVLSMEGFIQNSLESTQLNSTHSQLYAIGGKNLNHLSPRAKLAKLRNPLEVV